MPARSQHRRSIPWRGAHSSLYYVTPAWAWQPARVLGAPAATGAAAIRRRAERQRERRRPRGPAGEGGGRRLGGWVRRCLLRVEDGAIIP